ncbi:uncharacterized protein LOC110269253 [Arachis ipaensis]|uniref:uncharacterized protein LOC110269253 n=1 Tax=Arachis ipaensis TaxID=130454 RepID=UPI000A2B77B5|nr:uncharacterized protein LOC110269253 [Arachis ipaensis]
MPEATGNNPPNPVDFMATLGNMAAVHPPTFRGTSNPTNADNWIQAIERALQAHQVSEEQWVEFGTYQLQGEAQHWWQGMRRILQPDGVVISWKLFRTEFYKKYFSSSEILRIFAEWKCIKYKGGLRSNILSFVAHIEIWVFSELVNKSRIAEECVRNAAVAKHDNWESHRRDYHQDLEPRSQEFKRNENYRPNRQHKNKQGLCYRCGSPGHLVKGCPNPRGGNS